jgi:hypothetical protein
MFFRFLFGVVLISVIFGCRAGNLGSGTGVVSYEISFNTDKNYIINETSFILQLYEYTIEIVDPTKDYYVMQTYWRLRDGQMAIGSDTIGVLFRDRVKVHIIPRGRTSVYFRSYQIYNTVLEFEVQASMGLGNWVKVTPPKDYLEEYHAIVKEIKLRMLKYGPSSG